jgi:DNA-binding transcriptional MerR regulator
VTPDPGLSVAATARRLGVAAATLRTWDRRYGLGPSGHAAGAHRRYSSGDLARLERMRALLLAGMSTAEAAAEVAGSEEPSSPAPRPRRRRIDRALVEEQRRGLGRAAVAMDAGAVRQRAGEALTAHGLVAGWHEVICPVLVAAGERWEATGEGVEVEHLLTAALLAELQDRQPAVAETSSAPVLLACPDGDYHSLPLHALAAELAARGVASRLLGGSVPAAALTAAVSRTGPAVLVLYAQLAVADPAAVLAAVPATRPPVSVVVGGPGWGTHRPLRATVAGNLGHAADAVLGGLGRSH